MAALLKKYRDRFEKDAAPTASTPVQAAQLPDPVADPKLVEPVAESSPAEDAGKNAIRERLQEMEAAEANARQAAAPQQPHYAHDPQPDPIEAALAGMPERVQRWCREHPEFLTDPEKAAQAQYCHHVVKRETGQEFTDLYFERMERMLFGPAQSNGNASQQPIQPPIPRQQSAPVRQQYRGPAVSAPPTREVPSFSSGRMPSTRVPLTRAEVEIALTSKQHPDESDEDAIRRYAQLKRKVEEMKRNGDLQNG